jgi:peroxisomal membrane protein 4
MLALAKLAIQPNMHPLSSLITPEARTKITDNAWPVFASMTWAFVMYIFRWYPDTLASSLRSSMVYMYVSPYNPTLALLETRSPSILMLTSDYSYADSDHWDSLRTLFIHNK